jgi:hypothetical protein
MVGHLIWSVGMERERKGSVAYSESWGTTDLSPATHQGEARDDGDSGRIQTNARSPAARSKHGGRHVRTSASPGRAAVDSEPRTLLGRGLVRCSCALQSGKARAARGPPVRCLVWRARVCDAVADHGALSTDKHDPLLTLAQSLIKEPLLLQQFRTVTVIAHRPLASRDPSLILVARPSLDPLRR